MAGKRAREPTEEEAAAAAAAAIAVAALPPKSFMEESADALAGVEGALTGSKRKAAPSTSPMKKSPKMMNIETSERPRSDSIDRLADVAGSLLKDDLMGPSSAYLASTTSTAALAVAAAAATAPVPDPMAVVLPVPMIPPVAAKASNYAPAPTGFRKKGPATSKPAASATPSLEATKAFAAAATAAAAAEDGKGKKTQITYNPDIPMTKEQLTAWRREMRRVRNRESAAASRRKVRDRIEELEEEVDVWKRRYQEVMARLGRAENKKKKGGGADGKSGEGGEDVQHV